MYLFQVDFWVNPSSLNRFADIHLTSKNRETIYNLLATEKIGFSLLIDDIDNLLDKQLKTPGDVLQRSKSAEFMYSEYNTYEQVSDSIYSIRVS